MHQTFTQKHISSQFSCSVMSNSLRSHELQHARLLCPSSTPRACSNSCLLSQWCHPTISSSVFPFSSRLQSFPESGSLLMSQLFASGGQSIGASVSASVLPMNMVKISSEGQSAVADEAGPMGSQVDEPLIGSEARSPSNTKHVCFMHGDQS